MRRSFQAARVSRVRLTRRVLSGTRRRSCAALRWITMATVKLDEFIDVYRDELIRRCRAKVAARSIPPPSDAEIDHGVPLFLDQLVQALRLGQVSNPEIGRSAILHGHDLLVQGFSVSQVVHDYGDICQSITDLAMEMGAPISVDDFLTLTRC